MADLSDKTRNLVSTLSRSDDYRDVRRAAKIAAEKIMDYDLAYRIMNRYVKLLEKDYPGSESARGAILTRARNYQQQLMLFSMGEAEARRTGL
jgi:hypothetical protein